MNTLPSRPDKRRVASFCMLAAFGIGVAGAALAGEKPSYNLEDVKACSPDAMRLCKDKLPDLAAIQQCMKDNYARLRPACKTRFDQH